MGITVTLNLEAIVSFMESVFGIKFLAADVYFISDLPADLQMADVLRIGGIALMAKNTGTSLAAEAVVRASAGFAVAVATGAAIMGALVAVVASALSDTAPDTVAVIIDRPSGPHDVS